MASTPYVVSVPINTDMGPNPTIGLSPSDTVGFYNTPGVTQPFGSVQAALPVAGNAGDITTNSLSVAPGATVTLNTVLARAVTLNIPGPLTTDFALPINKLTSQAGLAVFSSRIAGANSLEITFGNNTGASIQPATEVCQYTYVSAQLCLTAVLSPASVAANTTVEQIFPVTGVYPGQIVFVSKPTTQTGLGIQNCRVVANNQVAIAFVNLTAAPIVPTAAETYSFFATSGLSAMSPYLEVGVQSVATAILTITSQEIALTAAQVLADDVVIGVSKPSLNAGVSTGSARAGAGTITQTWTNPTTGSVTPTVETLTYGILRHNQLAPMAVQTAGLIPISVAANTSAELTFTVPNLIAGTFVGINKPTLTPGICMAGVRVSATNTLAITFMNITGAAIVPPPEVYTILYSPNVALTGTSWIKFFGSQFQNGVNNLLTAIRSALVATGFIAGQ
jgi:hypothetical protein